MMSLLIGIVGWLATFGLIAAIIAEGVSLTTRTIMNWQSPAADAKTQI